MVHKGKVYYKSDAEDIWPESKDIEIGDIKATLYFQNLPLGDVKLNNIVGNFAGCFGETFLVLNDVGKNPSDKLYRDNLDKFELRNIKIIRGDVNLSYKRKQEIIKAISYDAWGNPKSKSSENSSTSGKQYDAFGNPINTNTKFNSQNSSTINTSKNLNNKQQYDAFGNPIKN